MTSLSSGIAPAAAERPDRPLSDAGRLDEARGPSGGDVVEWVTEIDAFRSLKGEWDALPRPLPAPFLRHGWFVSWFGAFGGDSALRVCCVRREGRLVAALPLIERRGRFRSMANRHTQIFTALAQDDSARARLVDAVVEKTRGDLELEAIPVDDVFLAGVERRCRELKVVCFREPLRSAPFVDLSGSFADFRLHGLNPATRRTIEKSGRRLERDTGASLSVIEAPKDPAADLEECFAVEASGWKGRDGTAIFSAADTTVFFRELGRSLADDGVLRLSKIAVDGRMIAFNLQALDGRRLWVLKTGYDEEYGRYSPGRVLQLADLERSFVDGLDTLEQLGSSDAHKLSVATGLREHCVFRSYRRAPLPLARLLYRRHLRPASKRVYLRHGGLSTRMALRRLYVRATAQRRERIDSSTTSR